MNLQVSCKSPGRNVTEATASQAPAPPSSSAPLHPASQRAHWRRRGSRHQPAPRLPDRASVSMGVTGFSAFPCCGKNSVNIVERKNDDYHHHHHPLEDNKDEDNEMGTELSSMKPPPKVDPDPVPHLEDMVTELTSTPIPETENPEQQNYRIESIKPYEEELTTTNTFKPRGFNVNSTNKEEEEVVCGHFRSTPVQTSKHLFWSNKLIQASEHSLQTALEKHHKSPGEKKSISIAQVYTECTQRPSSTQVSRTPTPTALGLADLINFASSLAVASSSNMALPNLGTMIKGTSEKAQNTSLDFCQPIQSIKFTQATQITQISSEKQDEPPEVMAHKSWTQETRNVACSYLDINESGLKKATIQGEVKFVQAPATSPELQEDKDDYYFQKQRDLRLSSCPRNRARGPSRPARAHTGLTFFCQAARLNGLSSSQLARSLHTLCRAGGRSPYTQIPNLAGRPRPDRKTTTRTAGPEVRLPKPQQPGRPKLPLNLGPLSKGPLRPPAGLMSQPLEQMRPSKLASSPPTLVQKHPSSPSSACFQRCTIKSLYK
uniref:Spermatogenesis associated 32 n=1 Tax=Rattus norvegicus TaxID=10116 RepID=A0ABK0LLR2_RAT